MRKRKMTIDRLTDAVTKLHDTAKALSKAQTDIDSLQRELMIMKDDLEILTDILEDEFHDVLMNEVMKDDDE